MTCTLYNEVKKRKEEGVKTVHESKDITGHEVSPQLQGDSCFFCYKKQQDITKCDDKVTEVRRVEVLENVNFYLTINILVTDLISLPGT